MSLIFGAYRHQAVLTPMTRVRYEQPHRHGVRAAPNWYKVGEWVLQGYHVELEFRDLKTEVLAEG